MRCSKKKPLHPDYAVTNTAINLQTRPLVPISNNQSRPTENQQVISDRQYHHSENLLQRLVDIPATTAASSGNVLQRKTSKHFSKFRGQDKTTDLPIQAKLNIGESDDKYEKEADINAIKVVHSINSPQRDHPVQKQVSKIQRQEPSMGRVSGIIQRDLQGLDPVKQEILDQKNKKDLLYGLSYYRSITTRRMDENQNNSARTIDEYNAAIGINIQLTRTAMGIYKLRNALTNPTQWRNILGGNTDYPSPQEIQLYQRDPQSAQISDTQKWMTFLVRNKHQIGLYDLGDKTRPVIKKGIGIFSRKKKGKEEGLTRLGSKRRFDKNTAENTGGQFTKEQVHEMLSFGTDTNEAQEYYNSLDSTAKSGVSQWIENALFRRTSKLGIDFAISNIGLNSRVHFNLASGLPTDEGFKHRAFGILDDIVQDKGTRKITESEWRYIKRLTKENPQLFAKILPYSEY